MTNYVRSATDKSGKKVIREIEAASAEDAKFVLLAQGYSNLELKEDEVDSVVRAGFPKRQNDFGAEISATAEQRLKHRDDPTATFRDAIRKGFGGNSLLVATLLGLAIYSGFRKQTGLFLLYLVVLLAWVACILYMSLQSVYYRKLVKADDWSRWNDVFTLVAILKVIGRFRKVKVPGSALTRHRAKALAGLGRMDEALAEYKQCEGRPDCPGWLYKLFLASLHTTAKQHDQAIECNLASIAEKPTSVAWADSAPSHHSLMLGHQGVAKSGAENASKFASKSLLCVNWRLLVTYKPTTH